MTYPAEHPNVVTRDGTECASLAAARHGAVLGAGGVPAHFGDPVGEWRNLVAGKACVELAMDVVSVTGTDRLRWLHSLASQHLESLAPGVSTEALIFDPAGHVQNAFFVYDDGSTTWLLTDSGMGKALVEFLDSMRFMMRVDVSSRPEFATFGTYDAGLLASLGASVRFVWRDPWPSVTDGGATYTVPGTGHPAMGWTRAIGVVDRGGSTEALEDVPLAGTLAWEAARIEGWRPRPSDALHRVLPHEVDWLRTAVHLVKGCYRGQETVAKLVNLGRPPRRLVELYLEGPDDELPVPGEAVMFGEREAGTVLSAVRHPEEGPVALAVVRRALPADAVVTCGNFVAGQRVICDPAGKSSASPAQRPGAEFRRGGVERGNR